MSSPADNIIEVENLTCAYGDLVITKDLTFDVRRGEIFIILGGSGCGKSTVLKHMIGLYPPSHGQIIIDGDDIGSAHGKARLDIIRRIGVMYQMGALFGSMTLLENVRLPLEEFTSMPREAMDYVARMKLALVGLEGSADKMPSELSGGMLKRGAIARAMALDPKILFLDEPSAGLDPITSAELDELIRSLSRSLGVTFVIVTHELQSIFSIADRIIMLDKSTKGIIATGDPRKLRDESDIPLVRRFFHREFQDKTSNAAPVTETI
ncbi:ABC transporter ATP-binding protein [Maridesulfovibrio frigidus]|uniref:ABC transporter ATP-binding protein n=1 Tax=Maridesulfovibrio frigidus TaxID=340956 RepID=UPI0004E27BC5|nr:ATP-binding cassette domain-containing protein [Maridesulfovibrio frigidus]